MKIGNQIAGRMSHRYLANCTQCHAPPPPRPFAEVDAAVASSFIGLPAPRSGSRAYQGAPPTIPHSTWMRESCLACHGLSTTWSGFESTHPWRTACTQCHAPSATLEQGPTVPQIDFVPGPRILKE
jgi:cytochrome c-type protein NapB